LTTLLKTTKTNQCTTFIKTYRQNTRTLQFKQDIPYIALKKETKAQLISERCTNVFKGDEASGVTTPPPPNH
jgi:predicted NUDIX family phosphoesterase